MELTTKIQSESGDEHFGNTSHPIIPNQLRWTDLQVTPLTDSSSGNSVLFGATCSTTILNVLLHPFIKEMWEHLHTSAHHSSAAICDRDEKEGWITTEDWPRWSLGGSETKQKRMECDWSCSTPVSALSSRCEWHGLASCWNVNWHATHTLITPNNPLHCYLPFNSQLSVRSYSVAPHNPCVLFSLLWQARVRFHLLPLLACDRVVKYLPGARGGSKLSEMCMTSRSVSFGIRFTFSSTACWNYSSAGPNWICVYRKMQISKELGTLSTVKMHIARLSRKLVSDWLVMFWISQSAIFLKSIHVKNKTKT